jgi:hypothetical protein
MSELRTNLLSNAAGTGPAGLFKQSAAKAWANLNGSTFGLRDSFGISSVVNNDTGDYSFNLTNAMTDANWADTFSSSNVGNANNNGSKTASLARIQTFNTAMTRSNSGLVTFTAHGDLA